MGNIYKNNASIVICRLCACQESINISVSTVQLPVLWRIKHWTLANDIVQKKE